MVTGVPIRSVIAIGIFLILVISTGHAQAFPLVSHVTTIVFDESGAVIPDSELVFRSSDSKELVSHTGADGSVTVSLQNGRYSVAITKLGFVKTEVRDVQVPVSEALRVVMKVAPTPINGPTIFDVGPTTSSSDLPSVVEHEPTRVHTWHYPDDRSAIHLQKPSKPYSARGLPDGIVAVLTEYRQPGFRVPRPEGGFWEFQKVAKLYYKGQLFALVGSATGISKGGHDLGWVTGLVIYDEDGDGKLDSPEGINDGTRPYVFHLPKWVKR